MKNIYKSIITSCLLILFITPFYAQNLSSINQNTFSERACGTNILHEKKLTESPQYAQNYMQALQLINQTIEERRLSRENALLDGEIITIPVVFHIIHDGEPVGTFPNLSEQQILDQIAQLNLDFRALNDQSSVPAEFQDEIDDLEIEFCLAVRDPDGEVTTGINRYNYGQSTFDQNDFENTIKPETIWDRNSYLNFWTCETLDSPFGELLGYAQFPGGAADTDGVVCIASSVGSVENPNPQGGNFGRGRTATHEIGHWFSLYHIWGDDQNEADQCSGTDLVSDTPNQAIAYTGSPMYPEATCGSNDMFMNYMDYVNDVTMVMFTFGQQERTSATLTSDRMSLQSSLGCTPVTGFRLEVIEEQSGICAGVDANIDFNLLYEGGYTGTVDFSVTGNPTGTSVSFSQDPVSSGGTYTLTVSNTTSIVQGEYNLTITGDDGIDTDAITINLIVSNPLTEISTLSAPADEATNVNQPISLEWTNVSGALNYLVEVSTTVDFTNIVYSTTTPNVTELVSGLVDETTYYWRITPQNNCGNGSTTATFSFTTALSPNCLNVITDGSFEESISPNPNWEEFSSNDFALIGTQSPNTGSNAAWLGGGTDETAIIWQRVTIPADATIANLHYFYSINSNENNCDTDYGGIAIDDDFNGEFDITYLNYGLCNTNDTNGDYKEDCFDLSSFAGQTIDVGFYAVTNADNQSGNLFIDDVSLEICTGAQDIVPTDTNEYIADYEMTDANGWTHYIDNNETPCNYLDDYLLLSLFKNGEDIGSVGDTGFEVRLVSNPTSTQISTDYNNNSLKWFSFNRYWNVSPVTQPTNPIKVRQYYAENDVAGMEVAAEAISGNDEIIDLTSLIAWKLNDLNEMYDVNPANGHPGIPEATSVSGDGLWQYLMGSTSSTTEFTVGTFPSINTGPFYFMEFEVAHFSGGGVANPQAILLPVDFSEFTAEAIRTNADLHWETASEYGNDYFEVQRSFDGTHFESISEIESLAGTDGNSQQLLTYDFTDKNVAILGNHIYYRIKQVDFDKDIYFSEIRLVDFSNTTITPMVFPNPVNKGESFVVQTRDIQSVQLISSMGQVIYSKNYDKQVHSMSISTSGLSSGIYFILINKTNLLRVVVR